MCKKETKQNKNTLIDLINDFSTFGNMNISIGSYASFTKLQNYEYKAINQVESWISKLSTKYKEIYHCSGPFDEILLKYGPLKKSLIDIVETQKSCLDDMVTEDVKKSMYTVFSTVSTFVNSSIVVINRHRNFKNEVKEEVINKNIFLVHGNEKDYLIKIKKMITKIGFCPVVMEEEKNNGIEFALEKFIDLSNDCSTCVVLLTNQINKEAPLFKSNPLIELGYFLNKIERKRIFIVTDVNERSLPSDINGSMIIKLSNKKWLNDLKKSLINL